MKYLLLLAKTSICEYAYKNAYHGLFKHKQNINSHFLTAKLFIKVFNGIINFKFYDDKIMTKINNKNT